MTFNNFTGFELSKTQTESTVGGGRKRRRAGRRRGKRSTGCMADTTPEIETVPETSSTETSVTEVAQLPIELQQLPTPIKQEV